MLCGVSMLSYSPAVLLTFLNRQLRWKGTRTTMSMLSCISTRGWRRSTFQGGILRWLPDAPWQHQRRAQAQQAMAIGKQA